MTEDHVLELGERAARFLRAENYGLARQRINAISHRPSWHCESRIVWEGDVPVRMVWDWVYR